MVMIKIVGDSFTVLQISLFMHAKLTLLITTSCVYQAQQPHPFFFLRKALGSIQVLISHVVGYLALLFSCSYFSVLPSL